jgi:hypothetical protein
MTRCRFRFLRKRNLSERSHLLGPPSFVLYGKGTQTMGVETVRLAAVTCVLSSQ